MSSSAVFLLAAVVVRCAGSPRVDERLAAQGYPRSENIGLATIDVTGVIAVLGRGPVDSSSR
jgi:hypothetical protein